LIERNAARLTILLVKSSRLAKSGQVPVEVTDVDIREVIERVLDERKIEIGQKGIQVIITNPLGTVRANATQIYQLFSNILGNAIKFNNRENPFVEITGTKAGIRTSTSFW